MTTAELKAAWLAFAGLYNQAKAAGDCAGQCEYWGQMEALLDVALEGR